MVCYLHNKKNCPCKCDIRNLIFAVLNLRLLDIQEYNVYLNVCVCFAKLCLLNLETISRLVEQNMS